MHKLSSLAFVKKDWWYLPGIFIAEGSLYFSRRGYAMEFSLGNDEKELASAISNILSLSGLNPNQHSIGRQGGGFKLRVYSKSFFTKIKRDCYIGTKKKLPMPKNKEAVLYLLAGLVDGDGYGYASGRVQYASSQNKLAISVIK